MGWETEYGEIYSEGYTKGYTAGNERAKEKDQEIQRLNNIIDEIERLLKDRIECVPETMAEVYEDELILEKLQKLKEGKKCLKRKKKN